WLLAVITMCVCHPPPAPWWVGGVVGAAVAATVWYTVWGLAGPPPPSRRASSCPHPRRRRCRPWAGPCVFRTTLTSVWAWGLLGVTLVQCVALTRWCRHQATL